MVTKTLNGLNKLSFWWRGLVTFVLMPLLVAVSTIGLLVMYFFGDTLVSKGYMEQMVVLPLFSLFSLIAIVSVGLFNLMFALRDDM